MTDNSNNTDKSEDLRTLINNSKETEHEDNETITENEYEPQKPQNKPEPIQERAIALSPSGEIMPKAGQKYWLSSEAKKKKNEYMREYNAKRKAELMRLQRCQLQQREIKLLLCNGQVKSFQLEEDSDYISLIKNLLGTLTDNSILKDYEIID